MRPSNHHQRRDLKSRTWSMLDQIGISEFASNTRVQSAALSKYAAPPKADGDPLQKEDQYIPVDILLDAELRTGPMLTRLLADIHGYELVAKEAGSQPQTITMEAVLRASKECADVTAIFLERCGNGLDLQDQREMRREIHEAINSLTSLCKMLGG